MSGCTGSLRLADSPGGAHTRPQCYINVDDLHPYEIDCGMGSSAIDGSMGGAVSTPQETTTRAHLRTCQRIQAEWDSDGVEAITLQKIEVPMIVVGP